MEVPIGLSADVRSTATIPTVVHVKRTSLSLILQNVNLYLANEN